MKFGLKLVNYLKGFDSDSVYKYQVQVSKN